jgi:hypothetical protein
MFEGRQEDIKLLTSMGYSLEDAQKVLRETIQVDQVREDTEALLGHKVPSYVSSRFIKEFCDQAVKIGVCAIQVRFNEGSTSESDWRFLTDLHTAQGDNLSSSWFSLQVSQSNKLDEQGLGLENDGVVSVLRVEGSPAQALAAFITEYGEAIEVAYARGDLSSLLKKEQNSILSFFAKQIDSLTFSTGVAQGGLMEMLQQPEIVPPYAPPPELHGDLIRAASRPGVQMSPRELFDSCKLESCRLMSLQITQACEAMFNAVGDGRSLHGRPPLEIFRGFKSEEERNDPFTRRALALAYLDQVEQQAPAMRAGQRDVQELVKRALADVEDFKTRTERRMKRSGDMPEDFRKKDEELLSFYVCVKNAIRDNRDFLVKMRSQ